MSKNDQKKDNNDIDIDIDEYVEEAHRKIKIFEKSIEVKAKILKKSFGEKYSLEQLELSINPYGDSEDDQFSKIFNTLMGLKILFLPLVYILPNMIEDILLIYGVQMNENDEILVKKAMQLKEQSAKMIRTLEMTKTSKDDADFEELMDIIAVLRSMLFLFHFYTGFPTNTLRPLIADDMLERFRISEIEVPERFVFGAEIKYADFKVCTTQDGKAKKEWFEFFEKMVKESIEQELNENMHPKMKNRILKQKLKSQKSKATIKKNYQEILVCTKPLEEVVVEFDNLHEILKIIYEK